MGESNGMVVRGNRISLLWSAVEATIIPESFCSNMGDTKYSYICRSMDGMYKVRSEK